MKTTLCLNMIVKNEAHVLQETFDNLCLYFKFDYWVICDTGSTDGTQTLIREYFERLNIPGELHEDEWKDFAYNRTRALSQAYNKTDYLLIFDADDRIVGKIDFPVFTKDMYRLLFGDQSFQYYRSLIINNRKKFKFEGVLHEYLIPDGENDVSVDTVKGDYYVVSGRTGARNKNPRKYFDDAEILEKAFETETNTSLRDRYAFYCAQSYMCHGQETYDKAIEWYLKVLTLSNCVEEKYASCIQLGNLYVQTDKPLKAVDYWIKTMKHDPERIEGVVHAVELFYNNGMHLFINLLYKQFKGYSKTIAPHKFFVEKHLYNDVMEFYNSVAGYYVNDMQGGYDSCVQILVNKCLDAPRYNKTFENIVFYTTKVKHDPAVFPCLTEYIEQHQKDTSDDMFTLWEHVFKEVRINLAQLPDKLPILSKPQRLRPDIMITFTTCKRYSFFEQTMNSILHTWEDVSLIDDWFCVDDNSTVEDRDKMKTHFSWIDYHFKNKDEKGHRKSMNIIWERLNKKKPTYWIHMEDDFVFFKRMKYVSLAKKYLNELRSQNVGQIVFNRTYGETIRDYTLEGFRPYNDDIVLHDFLGKHATPNNCYWPHFSFRPSMIRTDIVLQLGDFTSTNTFFERDYADRWMHRGFSTAFFNCITSIHIGRTDNVENAYLLNDESQFGSSKKKIKILNLKRRPDRLETMVELMKTHEISNYEVVEAIDGTRVIPVSEIRLLFKDNDFGNQKGFIGCALSHLRMWRELLVSTSFSYFIIFEDDISVCRDFRTKLHHVEKNMAEKDLILLGYHMFSSQRRQVSHLYDNDDTQTLPEIFALNRDLFVGGTFGYSINKNGARKLIEYISKNGIRHGIDYLFKIILNLDCFEARPLLCHSDWNEGNKDIDTDIQNNRSGVFDFSITADDLVSNFTIYKDRDCPGAEHEYSSAGVHSLLDQCLIALAQDECDGFNTKGILKKNIHVQKLVPSMGCDLYMKKNTCKRNFTLVSGKDFLNNDICRISSQNMNDLAEVAINMAGCDAFNSLGYFKKNVDETMLVETEWINKKYKEDRGLYVKNAHPPIRIKLMCNWCSPEELCNGWSKMTQGHYQWKHITFTWEDENIDYFIIINRPRYNDFYVPEKTIVFQMEPWIDDTEKSWGRKTWGDWSSPDPYSFLQVRSPKYFLNNAEWTLNTTWREFQTKGIEKDNHQKISSVMSSQYYDTGHIKRIDFLKFLQEKNDPLIDIDVFGRENKHCLTSYRGQVPHENKDGVMFPYKYYFMCENNAEENYMTEKIWDALLAECLCFYWGCPNATDYIDEKAFVQLDMNDFEKSYTIIRDAVKNDLWKDRIDVIRREKQKVLDYYSFCPTVERVLGAYETYTTFFGYRGTEVSTVCFIHSCTDKIQRTDVLQTIVERVVKSSLFDCIYIINIGDPLSKYVSLTTEKIKVIEYSTLHEWGQFATLHLVHVFCQFHPHARVCYLHTQGPHETTSYEYLLDAACLERLKNHDTVGVGVTTSETGSLFYHDNMWWATSKYICKLRDPGFQKDPTKAQYFVLANKNVCAFSAPDTNRCTDIGCISSYIIHSLDEVDKGHDTMTCLTDIGVSYHVFPAVSKSDILLTGDGKIVYRGRYWTYEPLQDELNDEDIACALSHLLLYERLISDDKYLAYFIVEDDSVIRDEKKQRFYTFLQHLPPCDTFDIAQFVLCTTQKDEQNSTAVNSVNNYYYLSDRATLGKAYLVTKTACQKILEFVQDRVLLPANDLLTFLNAHQDLRILCPRVDTDLWTVSSHTHRIGHQRDEKHHQYYMRIHLASWGQRLGNQMFQYSYLLAQHKRHGFQILTEGGSLHQFPMLEIQHSHCGVPSARTRSVQKDEEVRREEHFWRVDNKITNLTPDRNYVIEGYLQDFHYFDDFRPYILHMFSFKPCMKRRIEKYLETIFGDKIRIGIHLRFPDDMREKDTFGYTPPCVSYVKDTLMEYSTDTKVFVCSNNAQCAKEFMKKIPWVLPTISDMNPIEDICSLSLCDHIVLTTGSFGWWGAYLNTRTGRRVSIYGKNYRFIDISGEGMFYPGWEVYSPENETIIPKFH